MREKDLQDKRAVVVGAGAMGSMAVRFLQDAGLHDLVVIDPSPVVRKILDRAGVNGVQILRQGADDQRSLVTTLREIRPDVVVCMVPRHLGPMVAQASVEARIGCVSTNFMAPEVAALDAQARDYGVSVISEMGFDPGIDLLLLRESIDRFEHVDEIRSYGSGVPELPGSNPLNYAATWSFRGFLNACTRDARVVEGGETISIPGDQIFALPSIHCVHTEDGSLMEAYPNGDATRLQGLLGLPPMRQLGLYTMRWPGHCAFFYRLARLGFLDAGQPIAAGRHTPWALLRQHVLSHPRAGIGDPVWQGIAAADEGRDGAKAVLRQISTRDPFWGALKRLHFFDDRCKVVGLTDGTMRDVLACHLEPQLQLGAQERDKAILRIEVSGRNNDGKRCIRVSELVAMRDVQTGFLAMGRGVAHTAAIAALNLLRDRLPAGVHTPLTIPSSVAAHVLDDLEQGGLHIARRCDPL